MAIVIGGHPRSGTTLLCRLLESHPDVAMTREFGSFLHLGLPWRDYADHLRQRLKTKANLAVLRQHGRLVRNQRGRLARLLSRWFLFRYFQQLRRLHPETVRAADVERILQSLLGRGKQVGDKYPGYVFALDTLALEEDLRIVIIYRDCRHVVESTLRMVTTKWRGRAWTANIDTPAKIAAQWVEAVGLMEKQDDRVVAVRYEDLLTRPGDALAILGNRLELDPARFRSSLIRPGKVAGRQSSLSGDDLGQIMEVAGPTLRRLGYE